jgi:hypothetical protein
MKLSAWLFAVPTIGRSLRIIDRAMEASLSLSLSLFLPLHLAQGEREGAKRLDNRVFG